MPALYSPRLRTALHCSMLVAGMGFPVPARSGAQVTETRGHSIGRVSTKGKLIVVELDSAALGPTNLFNLQGRTLRFIPAGNGYRVNNEPLRWDSAIGALLSGTEVTLEHFTFPFSGRAWGSFFVGASGSIRFGPSSSKTPLDPYGHPDAGVILGRFDDLEHAASALVDSVNAICVFLKPRLAGPRYVKQLADRVVVTWNVSEPNGGLLDFHWFPTVNLFQITMHHDGAFEMSYKTLSARDGIIGVYPALAGDDVHLATLHRRPESRSTAMVDSVVVSVLDGQLIHARFVAHDSLPVSGPAIEGMTYRLDFEDGRVDWIVRGAPDPYNPHGAPASYVALGPDQSPNVRVSGMTLMLEGVLPPRLRGGRRLRISATVASAKSATTDHFDAVEIDPTMIRSAHVHFASVAPTDGVYAVIFEPFHYVAAPSPEDLACTVIGALGDRFDFIAYYADFRIDNQEASSPSFGPAANGHITGIGQTEGDPGRYCSRGRFQWGFAQPIYAGANEAAPAPPRGAPAGNGRDIAYYSDRAEHAGSQKPLAPFNYAMSHLGHEIAHRWGGYVSAVVRGDTIRLGPWPHWDPGLEAPVAFRYQLPVEASTLGGGVWQDRGGGTFAQLRDGYFVPATGYSFLDLYLMGFVSAGEVPPFFILRNLSRVGVDSTGRPLFRAQRTDVTVADVVAAEGPRSPAPDRSQHEFNTGIVLLTIHGHPPSRVLLERAGGIRRQWIDYWSTVTGHRAVMHTDPR